MGRFVFRRFISLIPTMFLIITFSFFLIRLAPGGPFSSEKKVTEEVMQNLLKKYHMDEPLYKQYFRYLGDICRGDLGPSFKNKDFTVNELYDLIMDRKIKMPENSYTTKLFNNEFYLKRKIMEEAFETVNYEQGDGLAWEAADLLYHLAVFMVKHDCTIEDIRNNLKSRTK